MHGPSSPGEQTLRRLTATLDLPQLEQVPEDHVLTKTFYILREFPGRWTGGKLWVEAIPPPPKNGAPPARRSSSTKSFPSPCSLAKRIAP